MHMSPLLWIVILILALMLLTMPPMRALISTIFTTFLIPALSVLVTEILSWMVWAVKKLLSYHVTVLRNLLTPHDVLYPSLESRRKSRGE